MGHHGPLAPPRLPTDLILTLVQGVLLLGGESVDGVSRGELGDGDAEEAVEEFLRAADPIRASAQRSPDWKTGAVTWDSYADQWRICGMDEWSPVI